MCAVCSLGVDAVIHCVSSYFIPSTTLGGRKPHPHFIDETTEASKCLSLLCQDHTGSTQTAEGIGAQDL